MYRVGQEAALLDPGVDGRWLVAIGAAGGALNLVYLPMGSGTPLAFPGVIGTSALIGFGLFLLVNQRREALRRNERGAVAKRQSGAPGTRQLEIERFGAMAVYGIAEQQVVVRGFRKTMARLTAPTLLHDHVIIYKVVIMYEPGGAGREQAVAAIRSAAERAMSDLSRRNRPKRTAV